MAARFQFRADTVRSQGPMLHAHVTPQCGEDGRMAGVTYLLQQGFETRAPTDREHLRARPGVARALTARSQRAGRFWFRGSRAAWTVETMDYRRPGATRS
jgi:hypothetical protein